MIPPSFLFLQLLRTLQQHTEIVGAVHKHVCCRIILAWDLDVTREISGFFFFFFFKLLFFFFLLRNICSVVLL